MTEAKRKTTSTPKLSISVSPLESTFEVTVPGSNQVFGLEEYYKFSLASDGRVIINDNEFSSKKQAAQTLEAIAAFLKK